MSKIFRISIPSLLIIATSCSHTPSNLNRAPSVDTSKPLVQIAPRSAVEARGKKWMVSTQGKYATQEAAKVLKEGGNIIEAAIVASLVIGVERPQSTGIGGGGFLIYHEAKSKRNYVIDFRERAPLKAHKKMYLDAQGEVIRNKSVVGSMAVAVPGMIRGLTYLHRKWGKRDWKSLVWPAQKLAEQGFAVYPTLEEAIQDSKEELALFPESKKIFLHADGSSLKTGETLVQKELGNTLRVLAATPEEFYEGSVAKKIVSSVTAHGGILSLKDLKEYQVRERTAIEADWKGYHVVSMPPPSSGGIHVVQILKLLENDPLDDYGFLSGQSLHLEASAMQQAFADRAKYLGDPDFVKVPQKALTAATYLKNLRAKFNLAKARPMTEVFAGDLPKEDENNTSHLTLMDQAGNVVVSTQTINGWFGSALVAEGTGIVLNNEMDDFSAKPGASNIFGATSTSTANQVEAKKTPLSSMSPTIILKEGKPVLALGAPGGTRIITSVAQTILNYLVFHQDLYHSVAAPRIHQQWQPDTLSIENQFVAEDTVSELRSKGWVINRTDAESNVMAIALEGDTFVGVADPRDIGTSQGE